MDFEKVASLFLTSSLDEVLRRAQDRLRGIRGAVGVYPKAPRIALHFIRATLASGTIQFHFEGESLIVIWFMNV